MASATSSSNSVASRASSGWRASCSLRRTTRSNSLSLIPVSPIRVTVAHAVSSTRASAATSSDTSSSAPDSEGGLSRNSVTPTMNADAAAALSGARSASLTLFRVFRL